MILTAALTTFLITGTVSYVKDGDTFVLDLPDRRETIRLWGMDAPEASQPGGNAAERLLRGMIAGSTLTCRGLYYDKSKRLVATCLHQETDLGAILVAAGYAMDWPAFSNGYYAELHRQARSDQRGLWAGDFQEPWEWRQAQRAQQNSG